MIIIEDFTNENTPLEYSSFIDRLCLNFLNRPLLIAWAWLQVQDAYCNGMDS